VMLMIVSVGRSIKKPGPLVGRGPGGENGTLPVQFISHIHLRVRMPSDSPVERRTCTCSSW
jgi:hypothetical protein